ncbi:MAG: hypothetical protein IPG45_05235 [Deltaproteobacteria bacterium]|nr:hypothetical protein [Deltaproteobacteria bacterium]
MAKLGPTGSTWVARLAAERQKERPSPGASGSAAATGVELEPTANLAVHRNHLVGLEGLWSEWAQLMGRRIGPDPALLRARAVAEQVLAQTVGGVPPAQRAAVVQAGLQSLLGLKALAGHPFLAPVVGVLARRVEGQRVRQARGLLSLSGQALEQLWPSAEEELRALLPRLEAQEGLVTTLHLALHLEEVLARSEAPLTLARERQIAQAVADFLVEEAPGNGLDLEGAARLAAAVDEAEAPGRRAEERLRAARILYRAQFAQILDDLEAQFAAEVELVPAARPIFESLERTLKVMVQGRGPPGPQRVAQVYHFRSEGLRYLQQYSSRLPILQANLQIIGRWLEALAPTPLAELGLHFAARLLRAGRGQPQDNLHFDLLPGRSAGEQAAGAIRATARLAGPGLSPALLEALVKLTGRTELGLLQFALCLGPEDLEWGDEHNVDLVKALADRPAWPSATDSNAALLAWPERRRRFWVAFRESGATPALGSRLAELAAGELSGEVASDLAEFGRVLTAAFPKVTLLDLWADDPEGPGLGRVLRRRSPSALLELWPNLVSALYADQLHRQEPSAQRRTLCFRLARAVGGAAPGGSRSAEVDPAMDSAARSARAEILQWVDGPQRIEPMSVAGRAELLRCAETIQTFFDHLGREPDPPPTGAGAEGPYFRTALHHVLRAVAVGAWPDARYDGPMAARLLAPLMAEQQLVWRQATAWASDDGWRPDREVLLCRARLTGGLHRLLAVMPGSPGPTSTDPRMGLKGSAQHRGLILVRREEQDRRVLLELSRCLDARGPGAATFDPALKITLGPARAVLLGLRQGGLAECTSVLARAAALEPRGGEGPYAIDDDRLSEFWCELPPGPNHPSGFRRGVTLTRAAEAHQRVVRVHQDGRRVALAGLMILSASWPGGRGPVLWLGPVEAQGGSTAEQRGLVEALAIHKAGLLGVPLVSTSASLLKAAARVGLTGRQVRVTLSLKSGGSGWVHLDGVVDGSAHWGTLEFGQHLEVQVDLQMILPRGGPPAE